MFEQFLEVISYCCHQHTFVGQLQSMGVHFFHPQIVHQRANDRLHSSTAQLFHPLCFGSLQSFMHPVIVGLVYRILDLLTTALPQALRAQWTVPAITDSAAVELALIPFLGSTQQVQRQLHVPGTGIAVMGLIISEALSLWFIRSKVGNVTNNTA